MREYGDTSTKLVEPELDLPTPEQAARRKDIKDEIERLGEALKTDTPELAAAQAEWEKRSAAAAAAWTVLEPAAS